VVTRFLGAGFLPALIDGSLPPLQVTLLEPNPPVWVEVIRSFPFDLAAIVLYLVLGAVVYTLWRDSSR
jgi:hypothetical protein